MSTNPYQSPQAESVPPKAPSPLRREALKSLRVATVLLTTAGLFNFVCFYGLGRTWYTGSSSISVIDVSEFQAGFLGTALMGVVCWFTVLPVLEFLSRIIHRIASRNPDTGPWQEALYVSLKPAALLAVPGFVLWIIWTIGFYYLDVNFFVISYAVGIPAHILAACLYVPLLFRWYKLWHQNVPRTDSEAS